MIRRVLVLGGAMLLLGLFAAGARAVTPEGPRLAFVRLSERPEKLELLTSDPSGLHVQVIAGGSRKVRPLPFLLDVPGWSPDGSLIAFSGLSGGIRGSRANRLRIFVVASDGSGLREVPGTQGAVGPVFAPDGSTIAFSRQRENRQLGTGKVSQESTTWLVDLNTGSERRLTPWGKGLESSPTSFSPDGAVLAMTRNDGRGSPEIVAQRLDGTGTSVLARNSADAVYSPDGAEIAFLRVRGHASGRRSSGGGAPASSETMTDLFVMNADGSQSRRLTDTPKGIEIWPSWDPSGQRLAYAQLHNGFAGLLGLSDSIIEMNADGTCRRSVISSPQLALYGPVWQPGAGREAGRLTC